MATLIQAFGLLTVAIGCGLIYPPAGVVSLGLGAVAFGLAMERN